MVVACWSAKGGSGTTVVASVLALTVAARGGAGALLVDLAGDVPVVLGLPDSGGPGVTGWAAAGDDVPTDALARLEVPVVPHLSVLARGEDGVPDRGRLELLMALLATEARTVIVDCGTLQVGSPIVAVAESAAVSLLVTRACYLALRRAPSMPVRPTGIVLVEEPGRCLQVPDVETVVGAPVCATVPVDIGVARAVDAGLLTSRLPRKISRPLAGALGVS
ncbi:MAG: hypothetical protein ACXIVQ_03150 [Acidimicrobiales bacterium]